MKVVKRVIVGVLVAALAAGGIYTGLMHVKESKVTEVPVTSVSNLQTDWYSENNTGWNHHHECFSECKYG